MALNATAAPDTPPRIDLHVERREERRKAYLRSARDLTALAILISLWFAALAPLTIEMARLRTALATTAHQADDAEKRYQTLARISANADARLARLAQFEQTRARRRAWAATLNELAVVSPPDTCFEAVSVEMNDKFTNLSVQGSAVSMSALHNLMRGLGASTRFTGIALTDASSDDTFGPGSIHIKVIGRVGGALATGTPLDK